jgi:hypothetical protein
MTELPVRTNAAWQTEMREKVTDSWPLNLAAKKSHAAWQRKILFQDKVSSAAAARDGSALR